MKGDRFIKDCQHIQFINDSVELVSKAGNCGEKDDVNLHSVALINLGFILLMTVYDKENVTEM